jgi:hypothetical protein
MAGGQMQSGGLLVSPSVATLGVADWAGMSSMQPGHPLVGGSAGRPGYEGGQRQVVVSDPSQAAMSSLAGGAPARGNWSEIFNLKGNPIGWVLIASILYLGLMHIHVNAGVSGGFAGGRGK